MARGGSAPAPRTREPRSRGRRTRAARPGRLFIHKIAAGRPRLIHGAARSRPAAGGSRRGGGLEPRVRRPRAAGPGRTWGGHWGHRRLGPPGPGSRRGSAPRAPPPRESGAGGREPARANGGAALLLGGPGRSGRRAPRGPRQGRAQKCRPRRGARGTVREPAGRGAGAGMRGPAPAAAGAPARAPRPGGWGGCRLRERGRRIRI